jgi:hypothetical protein
VGDKIWSFTLRVEHRLGVLENRLLRRIYELMREEVKEREKNFIMRRFIICTSRQMSKRSIKSR